MAAAAGYQLYLSSSGEITRDGLNAALAEQGLPAVSPRMMSHYRALMESGLSEYISINEFDLKRRKKRRKLESIYISATPGYDLRPVVSGLLKRGLEVASPGEAMLSGSIADAFRGQIAKADAFLAIVMGLPYDSVLFELGLAFGLRKPIIFGVDRQLSELLIDYQWLHRVTLGSTQHERLFSAVDRLRERPISTSRTRRPSRRGKVDISRFESTTSELSGPEFESVVADLLQECGADVSGRSASQSSFDNGFDFAVWAPALEPVVPNPLLVEVKLRLTSSPHTVFRQVSHYLEQSGGAGVALLIYRDGPPSEELGRGTFPVLPIRFDELVEDLKHRPLHETILRRRNLAVHFFAT